MLLCHAAKAAAQASDDLATGVDDSAGPTSAEHASADLTSAVHAPAGPTIAVQASHAVPTTVCRSMRCCPPSRLVTDLLSVFRLIRRRHNPPRPSLPRPCALLRPRALPPRLRLSPAKTRRTKVPGARAARPSARVIAVRRPVAAGQARPQRPSLQ